MKIEEESKTTHFDIHEDGEITIAVHTMSGRQAVRLGKRELTELKKLLEK